MGHRFEMAYSKFKAAHEKYQEELKRQDIPLRPGEKSIHEITHEKFAEAGRYHILRTFQEAQS